MCRDDGLKKTKPLKIREFQNHRIANKKGKMKVLPGIFMKAIEIKN